MSDFSVIGFIRIRTEDDVLALHTAAGDVTVEADHTEFSLEQFTGAGSVVSISSIVVSADGTAPEIRIVATPISDDLRDLALQGDILGNEMEVFQGIGSLENGTFRIRFLVFMARGFVSGVSIDPNGIEVLGRTPSNQTLSTIGVPQIWNNAQQKHFIDEDDDGFFQASRNFGEVGLIYRTD